MIGSGLPVTVSAYAVVVVLEGLFASVLFSLLGVAYYKRRSLPYLLLWFAATTLVVRSIVGVLPMVMAFDTGLHLLVDHGLDIVLVLMTLGAIYSARELDRGGAHA